jgi:hypothetical protein
MLSRLVVGPERFDPPTALGSAGAWGRTQDGLFAERGFSLLQMGQNCVAPRPRQIPGGVLMLRFGTTGLNVREDRARQGLMFLVIDTFGYPY